MRLHLFWLMICFPLLLIGKLETCRHEQTGDQPKQPGVIRTLTAAAFRHSGPVTELAIADGGKQIVSGSWNEGAVLWDTATGIRLKNLADRVSMAMALSPSGDLLA